MEINGRSFPGQLHSILGAIACSHFVSFDLELSGIPGKQPGQLKAPGRVEDGKQTLQERYHETKRAAERYHILQLGLTCVNEDTERGVYVLRPYNFFLNPIPDKRLEIEREFTYQSGAAEFLLSVRFRMEAPFLEGVPYFSREEEARARVIAAARRDKASVEDIFIPEEDGKSLDFIRRVRQEVIEWRSRGISEDSYLNIAPVEHISPAPNGRGLNGYQKRLVHQLIRAEFPEIVSISKFDFIQLIPYDQKREDAQLKRKEAWFEQNLARQIGLRWIAEALCPDVDRILPEKYTPPHAFGDLSSVSSWISSQAQLNKDDLAAYTDGFNELLSRLKNKRTVLVGHNIFLDLIYFYSCFFGDLPEKVEDFQHIIAQLFPLVVDTKYLADKINDNSPLYRSSLMELDQELSKLPVPIIETPRDYDKYTYNSQLHEAGFDSFLTAKILVRLSARIAAAAQGEESPSSEDEMYHEASEYGINQADLNYAAQMQQVYVQEMQTAAEIEGRDGTMANGPNGSAFSHNNRYAILEDPGIDENSYSSSQEHDSLPVPPPPTMMPHGEDPFWIEFGNKLRVNGTVEEVCVIR